MVTIEAVYDNGNILILHEPIPIKAKVLISFIEEINSKPKQFKEFPTRSLGKMAEFNRNEFYEEFLSDRF
jgi:hypothetical protein